MRLRTCQKNQGGNGSQRRHNRNTDTHGHSFAQRDRITPPASPPPPASSTIGARATRTFCTPQPRRSPGTPSSLPPVTPAVPAPDSHRPPARRRLAHLSRLRPKSLQLTSIESDRRAHFG